MALRLHGAVDRWFVLLALGALSGALGQTPVAPTSSGMVSWFKSESIQSSGNWPSSVGSFSGRVTGGTAALITASGNGACAAVSFLSGTTATTYSFGAVIPSTEFSICVASRYASGTQGRILQGTVGNMLFGNWNGYAGFAYFEGWTVALDANGGLVAVPNYSQAWTVSCGTNANPILLVNGVNVFSAPAPTRQGGGPSQQLVINTGGHPLEKSDWNVMELITWNRGLSLSELQDASTYLIRKLNPITSTTSSSTLTSTTTSRSSSSTSTSTRTSTTSSSSTASSSSSTSVTVTSTSSTSSSSTSTSSSTSSSSSSVTVTSTSSTSSSSTSTSSSTSSSSSSVTVTSTSSTSSSSTSTSSSTSSSSSSVTVTSTSSTSSSSSSSSSSTSSSSSSTETSTETSTSTSSRSSTTSTSSTSSSTTSSSSTATSTTSSSTSVIWCNGLPSVSWPVLPAQPSLPRRPLQAYAVVQGDCPDLSGTTVSLLDLTAGGRVVTSADGSRPAQVVRFFDRSSTLPSAISKLLSTSAATASGSVFWIAIGAGATLPGRRYRLVLQNKILGTVNAGSADLVIDAGPTDGAVDVTPTTGKVLQTLFTVRSNQWQSTLRPLSFAFWQRPFNSSENKALLADWNFQGSAAVYLPAGEWEVIALARDSLGMEALIPVSSGSPVTVAGAALGQNGTMGFLQAMLTATESAQVLSGVSVVVKSLRAPTPVVTNLLLDNLLQAQALANGSSSRLTGLFQVGLLGDILNVSSSSSLGAPSKSVSVLAGALQSVDGDAEGLGQSEAQGVAAVASSLSGSAVPQLGQLMEGLGQSMARHLASASSQPAALSVSTSSLVVSAFLLPVALDSNGTFGSVPPAGVPLAKPLPPAVLAAATQSLMDQGFVGSASIALSSSRWTGAGAYGSTAAGDVVSMSVSSSTGAPLVVQDLKQPLVIAVPLARAGFGHQDIEAQLLQGRQPECRWWDHSSGGWSGDGCRLLSLDGSNLHCACTHLTAFGAIPSQSENTLDFVTDLFGSMIQAVVFCANVEVFSAAGMRALCSLDWSSRPSGSAFLGVMVFFAVLYLVHVVFDIIQICSQDSQGSLERRGCRAAASRCASTCVKNSPCFGFKAWCRHRAQQVTRRVAASRLSVCPRTLETLKELEGSATGVENVQTEQERVQKLSQLQQAAGICKSDSIGYEELCDDVVEEFLRGGLHHFSTLWRILMAIHPLQRGVPRSLHYFHGSRALLTMGHLLGSAAAGAFFFNSFGIALSSDSPAECIPELASDIIVRIAAVSMGSVLIGYVPIWLLERIEEKPIVMRRGRPQSLMALHLLAFNLLPLAWCAAYALYIALFLANIQEASAHQWLLLSFLVCVLQFLLLSPLLTTFFHFFITFGFLWKRAELAALEKEEEQEFEKVVDKDEPKGERDFVEILPGQRDRCHSGDCEKAVEENRRQSATSKKLRDVAPLYEGFSLPGSIAM